MILHKAKETVLGALPPPVLSRYRAGKSLVTRWVLRALPDARLTPVQRFRRDGHNDLLLKDLPLDDESSVLDFGGYLGDYSAAIVGNYGSQVHVFEPIPQFVEALERRFKDDPRVTIHDYGIARKEGATRFGLTADGTGAFADGTEVLVRFKSATETALHLPPKIHVAAINIEGGEYELIPALDEAGLLGRIERLFIQFHRLGTDPVTDRESCRHILRKTHEMVWDYDFVWEAWVHKGPEI